ncbi:MAG: GtrA family protein [Victivallales bacterium]|jgi:putative flippase GtrA|nr:GtrA family protein [Victivallales bacterium]
MMLFQLCKKSELRQFARYLLVGGWNTLFGVGLFTLAYESWGTPRNYLLIAVPSNIIAVTNAFLCYKWFVFRTHGNYWKEYIKCWTIYGSSTLLGIALLAILVELFKINPVWANILLTAVGIIWSYLGHRFFSFRNKVAPKN